MHKKIHQNTWRTKTRCARESLRRVTNGLKKGFAIFHNKDTNKLKMHKQGQWHCGARVRVCRELLTGRRRIEAVPPPWHGGACRDLSEWQAWYSDPSFLTNTNKNTDNGIYKARQQLQHVSFLIGRFFRSQVSNPALSAPFICVVSLWQEMESKMKRVQKLLRYVGRFFYIPWGWGIVLECSCHVSCPG